MLISRTYPLRRSLIPKVIAGLAVAAVVAGCGSSTTTTSTPAAPPASASAAAPAGSSTTFDPALVGTTATKASKTSPKLKPTPALGGTSTTAASASEGLALTSGVTPSSSAPAKTTSTAATATTPAKATTTTPAKTTPPKTIVKTIRAKPQVKIVTVTKYQPKYITKVVTVAPKVPAGAFLPSTHPALSLTSFKVASGGVGCVIGGGSVRCDVARQSWTAPTQPSSCTQSWGAGIVLVISAHARLPQFACGGTSGLRPGAKVVQNGFDDTVGGITCQVRGFGVNCFAADKKGFIVSPTGYILY